MAIADMALPRKVVFFAAAGIAGFIVDVAVLYVFLDLAGPYLGRAFSFTSAVVTTYLINRNFTFAKQAANVSHGRGFSSYFLAMLGGGLVNYGLYAGLVTWVTFVVAHPVLGVAAGSIAGMSVNFLLSDKWVFRPRSGSNGA